METDQNEMSGGVPAVQAIASKLKQFAGGLLESARSIDDLGCLTHLPVVQANVRYKPVLSVADWQEGIREALLQASEHVNDSVSVLAGRRKRVTVSAQQVTNACVVAFNLDQGATLKANERREKVRKILGIECEDKTYRGAPGVPNPEQDLMEILAGALLRAGDDVVEMETEALEVWMAITDNFNFSPHFRNVLEVNGIPLAEKPGVESVEIRRTLRARLDGATRFLDVQEVLGQDWLGLNGSYTVRSRDCFIQVQERGASGSMAILAKFAPMPRGSVRCISYEIMPRSFHLPSGLFVQPRHSYPLVAVNLRIPPTWSGDDLRVLKEWRQIPDWQAREVLSVRPERVGEYEYRYEVQRPSPHLILGIDATLCMHALFDQALKRAARKAQP